MITLIAAIGRNNELGLGNKLLWYIPGDIKHFRDYTCGKVVIMGGNTFVSVGRILPGRKNIVITRNKLMSVAILAKDVESALSIEHCYPELVVIGGESIYKQTIGYADKLIITHVDAEFKADVFFPIIDPAVWEINSVTIGGTEPYNYKFIEYIRNESSRDFKREAG